MTTDSGNYTVTTGLYTGSTLNTTAGTGGWNGTTYTAGIELSTELSQCPEKTPTTNKAISFLKAPAIAFTIKNLKTAKLERQHKNHNWRAELRIFAKPRSLLSAL